MCGGDNHVCSGAHDKQAVDTNEPGAFAEAFARPPSAGRQSLGISQQNSTTTTATTAVTITLDVFTAVQGGADPDVDPEAEADPNAPECGKNESCKRKCSKKKNGKDYFATCNYHKKMSRDNRNERKEKARESGLKERLEQKRANEIAEGRYLPSDDPGKHPDKPTICRCSWMNTEKAQERPFTALADGSYRRRCDTCWIAHLNCLQRERILREWIKLHGEGKSARCSSCRTTRGIEWFMRPSVSKDEDTFKTCNKCSKQNQVRFRAAYDIFRLESSEEIVLRYRGYSQHRDDRKEGKKATKGCAGDSHPGQSKCRYRSVWKKQYKNLKGKYEELERVREAFFDKKNKTVTSDDVVTARKEYLQTLFEFALPFNWDHRTLRRILAQKLGVSTDSLQVAGLMEKEKRNAQQEISDLRCLNCDWAKTIAAGDLIGNQFDREEVCVFASEVFEEQVSPDGNDADPTQYREKVLEMLKEKQDEYEKLQCGGPAKEGGTEPCLFCDILSDLFASDDVNGLACITIVWNGMEKKFEVARLTEWDHPEGTRNGERVPSHIWKEIERLLEIADCCLRCRYCHRLKSLRNGDHLTFRLNFSDFDEELGGKVTADRGNR